LGSVTSIGDAHRYVQTMDYYLALFTIDNLKVIDMQVITDKTEIKCNKVIQNDTVGFYISYKLVFIYLQ
jgi:hypothetical protein